MTSKWIGWVKVKLLHRAGGTVILPELVIAGPKRDRWIQPQFFYPPTLVLDDDPSVTIAVAALDRARHAMAGLDMNITFRRSEYVATLDDHSEVYRCEITSSRSPAELAIGEGRRRSDGGIDIRLYHHTTNEALKSIRQSRCVRGSAWNFQGTRALDNVAYAYFTSMNCVMTEADLQAIAMASSGRLAFRLDTNQGVDADLELDVYRESTLNRRATLRLWTPAESVTTPHVWMHIGNAIHYEIAHPWIYRVGLKPGRHLDFDGAEAKPRADAVRRFSYSVLGDCSTLAGLKAPFDEENTTETFVVEPLDTQNLFDFWMANANTPLHSCPSDVQTFSALDSC